MEQTQKYWVPRARALPRKVLTRAIVQVKERYKELKNRYGPRYTSTMLSAAFLTLFLPIPGITLVSVALVVLIAEVHRAISQRGGFPGTITDLVVVVKSNMPCGGKGR